MKKILLKALISLVLCLCFTYFLIETNEYNLFSFLFGIFYMGLYIGVCEFIDD